MGFFGSIKKAITAPVKLIGKVVKIASPIVKIAKPILKPVFDLAVPEPVKKIIKIVKKLRPVMKLIKLKRTMNMNNFEKKLRSVMENVFELKGKSGIELALGAGFLLQELISLMAFVRSMDHAQLVTEATAAVDGMIGSEPEALIGPNGSYLKLDIPFIDDEKLYDLILGGVKEKLLGMSPAPEPPASSDLGGAGDTHD